VFDELFMRVVAILLLAGLFAGLAPAVAPAAGGPKVALVIGNAQYPDNDSVMKDVSNDTQDVAEELRRNGFEVERSLNVTGDGMRAALERFYRKIRNDSVALFFFDGFGVQSARQTYLLGIDAPIWEEKDVVRDGFNLETIIQEMSNRGALVKIALIDAARRNPFERRIRRYSAGLAPAVTPSNTLVMYSTALGSVISSAPTDRSLFVTELLREIRAPGTTAEQAFRNTQAGVVSASRGEQVPWLSSSMTTDFAFFGGPAPTPTPIPKKKAETPEPPTCEAAVAVPPPSADELASDPKIADQTRRIQQDPDDRVAYYKRGQLYAIKRAYAQAVADFDQAIRRNIRAAEIYNNRCWARAGSGQLLDALRDCDQALLLKPDLYDALDSRGLVNLKLGRYREAINDYTLSLDKNPHSSSSMFGRGVATKFSGGDGTADISQAKSMDHDIAVEFAGYGVNECRP
jgi:tetratricopeptide (TPR) repeat protein